MALLRWAITLPVMAVLIFGRLSRGPEVLLCYLLGVLGGVALAVILAGGSWAELMS